MIVLVHGPDSAIARSEVTRLLDTHDPDRTNTTSLDGREVALPRLIADVGSAAFFGGRRVMVVNDLMARASRSQAGADPPAPDPTEGESGAAPIDFGRLFAAVPDQNLLILVDASLSAIPAAVKRAAPDEALIVAGEPPRGGDLVRWLVAAAREAGGELDQGSARFLAERLYPQSWSRKPSNPRYDRPPDMDLLKNEVEKLVLAAYPESVSRGLIEVLVTGAPDDKVFQFVDAVEGGDQVSAVRELERLVAAGEEPAKLIAQVYQQIELAAVLAVGGKRDPVEIGRVLGLSNPNRMAGIARSPRKRTPGSTKRAVQAALHTDRRFKQGRLRQPADAMYDLIAAISTSTRQDRR